MPMSKWGLCVVALAVIGVGLPAESALAKTVVVEGDGLATCNPGPQHFTTIQAAVTAVSTFPGSTVLVCPGSYPEQVVIGQTILLKGISNGTGNAVVITVPTGGLQPNVTTPSLGPVAAKLVVQNASNVKVQGIAVDGFGGTCPTLVAANHTAGIVFLNIGDPSWLVAAGFITNNVVRNQNDGCPQLPNGGFGGLGEAIISENSYITINGNEIHNYDLDGIIVTGGAVNINGNNIQGGADVGIALHGAIKSAVTDNNMYGERGIVLDAGATGVIVNGNMMGPFTSTGIELFGVSGNTVTNNEVDVAYAGYVLYQSSGNTVTGNTAFDMSSYGIVDEQSAGGNTIINNTVNEAVFCVVAYQNPPTSIDIMTPNNLVNCKTIFTTNPF